MISCVNFIRSNSKVYIAKEALKHFADQSSEMQPPIETRGRRVKRVLTRDERHAWANVNQTLVPSKLGTPRRLENGLA